MKQIFLFCFLISSISASSSSAYSTFSRSYSTLKPSDWANVYCKSLPTVARLFAILSAIMSAFFANFSLSSSFLLMNLLTRESWSCCWFVVAACCIMYRKSETRISPSRMMFDCQIKSKVRLSFSRTTSPPSASTMVYVVMKPYWSMSILSKSFLKYSPTSSS